MLGFVLFFVTLWAALSAWAVLSGLLLWRRGLDTSVQIGLGPAIAAVRSDDRLQFRLGAIPIGAWVRGEPTAEASLWIGIAVHAGLAALSGAVLALAGGWPAGAVHWMATVVRFGRPETGGVLRTVWAESPWIVAHPVAAVVLVVFVLSLCNVNLGTLQRLAGERPALQMLVAFGPLPWLLWLLWLDLFG